MGNGAPTADAPNLQRRVYEFYDVAAAATECNQTQAHGGTTVWGGREGTSSRSLGSRQGNSLSCHSCRTALYENGTTGVRIMKLTDLTS